MPAVPWLDSTMTRTGLILRNDDEEEGEDFETTHEDEFLRPHHPARPQSSSRKAAHPNQNNTTNTIPIAEEEEEDSPCECFECGTWIQAEEAQDNDGFCCHCVASQRLHRLRLRLPEHYTLRQVAVGSRRRHHSCYQPPKAGACVECAKSHWTAGEWYVTHSLQPWASSTDKFCLDCAEQHTWSANGSHEDEDYEDDVESFSSFDEEGHDDDEDQEHVTAPHCDWCGNKILDGITAAHTTFSSSASAAASLCAAQAGAGTVHVVRQEYMCTSCQRIHTTQEATTTTSSKTRAVPPTHSPPPKAAAATGPQAEEASKKRNAPVQSDCAEPPSKKTCTY